MQALQRDPRVPRPPRRERAHHVHVPLPPQQHERQRAPTVRRRKGEIDNLGSKRIRPRSGSSAPRIQPEGLLRDGPHRGVEHAQRAVGEEHAQVPVAVWVPRGSERARGRMRVENVHQQVNASAPGRAVFQRLEPGPIAARPQRNDGERGGRWDGPGTRGCVVPQAAHRGEVPRWGNRDGAWLEVDRGLGLEDARGERVVGDGPARGGVEEARGARADHAVGAQRVENPSPVLRQQVRRRREGWVQPFAVAPNAGVQESLHGAVGCTWILSLHACRGTCHASFVGEYFFSTHATSSRLRWMILPILSGSSSSR